MIINRCSINQIVNIYDYCLIDYSLKIYIRFVNEHNCICIVSYYYRSPMGQSNLWTLPTLPSGTNPNLMSCNL